MNTSQNQLVQIYNSRRTILELLSQVYDYNTSDYTGFSVNEIDTMISNDQLDMLLTETVEGSPVHKTYIKFFLKNESIAANKLATNNAKTKLNQVIEDLYVLTNTLSTTDCLIMIIEGETNDTMINHLKYIYENNNIFVVVQNIKRLQFNILKHILVPKVEILTDNDILELKKRIHIESFDQLPEISRYDPQAMAICLRPGQICKFTRKSPTALETDYYRYCVT
jgi:DNA-directed RNA polymerase subunit H (RpoH/RPB5)